MHGRLRKYSASVSIHSYCIPIMYICMLSSWRQTNASLMVGVQEFCICDSLEQLFERCYSKAAILLNNAPNNSAPKFHDPLSSFARIIKIFVTLGHFALSNSDCHQMTNFSGHFGWRTFRENMVYMPRVYAASVEMSSTILFTLKFLTPHHHPQT